MKDKNLAVSRKPSDANTQEEEPTEKFKEYTADEAYLSPQYPSKSPHPCNQPLAGGFPIANTIYAPLDTSRLLDLENGESNCFVIGALHVIHAMKQVASGLLNVSDDSPRCLWEMSNVFNHRTHSVNDLRGLLGAEFSEGYGDVKDVLEHILTNSIPTELQPHFRFYISVTMNCGHKPASKQRNLVRFVLHQSINRDDFLEDVVEHKDPVMCTVCDDVTTPRVQFSATNAVFKYLIVILNNRDKCDVHLRGEIFKIFGRRMHVTAAVQYRAKEKHYVVWRRVPDRRNPWRLIDPLKPTLITSKFLDTLREPFCFSASSTLGDALIS
ncbi:hypothetical protein M3Y99_01758900 [Aphelenchoides fujianensis]|nr:hypothetical protein M3Y99_01758900 [Aphelenchoides fujianensis]